MLKRMILAGLLAAVAVPAVASDVTYDVRVLSPEDAASAAQAHKARTERKTARAVKHECTCEGQQAHARVRPRSAPQPH